MSETTHAEILTESLVAAHRGILAFHPDANDLKMVALCDSHEALRRQVSDLTQERDAWEKNARGWIPIVEADRDRAIKAERLVTDTVAWLKNELARLEECPESSWNESATLNLQAVLARLTPSDQAVAPPEKREA